MWVPKIFGTGASSYAAPKEKKKEEEEEERRRKNFYTHFWLSSKIITFEPKKNSTCGFHLRIEEGEIYSEKNKSGP